MEKFFRGVNFGWRKTGRFWCAVKMSPAATGRAGALRTGVRDSEDWLRTGDIGEVDAEGNLRFKGRKKNVIVTPAGLNVYPEDVEAALRKQPGVRDCVVIPDRARR